MTALITLLTAGVDLGPFDLYANLDSFTVPFETGVSKASLLAGFTSSNVPDFASIVRCKSTGICTNYLDIPLQTPTYEIAGCRSDYSFFAAATAPFLLGDIVFFVSNNPIFTGVYCGTIISISTTGVIDISLTGLQPTDCGDETCADDFEIIP